MADENSASTPGSDENAMERFGNEVGAVGPVDPPQRNKPGPKKRKVRSVSLAELEEDDPYILAKKQRCGDDDDSDGGGDCSDDQANCAACKSGCTTPWGGDGWEEFLQMARNFKFEISLEESVNNLYYEYKVNTRPALIAMGDDPGPWSRPSIRAHFTRHIEDAGWEVKKQTAVLRTLVQSLEDSAMEEDEETGRRQVNEKNVTMLLKCNRAILDALKTKPQHTISHNTKLSFSTATEHRGGNSRSIKM